jgi:TolB-like protein/predicted Zn-dependent protease
MNTDLSKIWQDLRRRSVIQVCAIYAAVAWFIVEVVSVVAPATNMPDWVMTAAVGLAMIGFPIAAILAWLFDVGKGGVVRTRPGSATGILAIVVSLGLLVAGTTGFVWLIKPGEQTSVAEMKFDLIAGSIAVMPFDDLSPNHDFVHFTDGIAQVVIHKLSAIAELTVIASKSSFAMRDDSFDMRTIGQKLRAEKLLVGSVQRSENSLRISTQLVDTRTGESVWSEIYDRQEKDIFDIQDEIALAIANNLAEPLTPEIRSRVTEVITSDLDAYDLYLLGAYSAQNTVNYTSYAEAIEYFEQALALDPDLALAWAGLASATFWHGAGGYIPFDEAQQKSREQLAKALAINPELGEAYSHAIILAVPDQEAARLAFEKAVEYSPSYWQAYYRYGLVLDTQFYRHAEAAEVLSKGLALQPYKPEPLLRASLGRAYARAGEYEKGMRLLAENYAEMKGTETEGQYILLMARAAHPAYRYDDAIAAYEIAMRDGYESIDSRRLLSMAYLAVGDIRAASKEIDRAEQLLEQEPEKGRNNSRIDLFLRFVRLDLDIVVNDVQYMLLNSKDLLARAESDPDNDLAWFDLYAGGLLSIILGRFDDGARAMETVLLTAQDPENYALAAYAHSQLGNMDRAKELREKGRENADQFLQRQNGSADALKFTALFLAMDEQPDEAISFLQRLYDKGYRDHAYLSYMPPFDPIRNDPRFVEILRLMHADTQKMRERVDSVRDSGDWESLIERFSPQRTASR